jgi:hypothetical protein
MIAPFVDQGASMRAGYGCGGGGGGDDGDGALLMCWLRRRLLRFLPGGDNDGDGGRGRR